MSSFNEKILTEAINDLAKAAGYDTSNGVEMEELLVLVERLNILSKGFKKLIVSTNIIGGCPFGRGVPSRCKDFYCGTEQCLAYLEEKTFDAETCHDTNPIQKIKEPCPFCNNTGTLISGPDKAFSLKAGYFLVACHYQAGGCGSCGPMRETADEAITLWNRRAKP